MLELEFGPENLFQLYFSFASFSGINLWPGKQIHCHNYRTPEPFRNRVVVLIGSSMSAADLSIEIAEVAREVHIASRSVADETYEKQPGHDNLWLHSMVESASGDGTVVFRFGSAVVADIILHCTGMFFLPSLAPGLSFVGIPWKAVPFPMSEFQSKWIAGVLSGRFVLPSPEHMMDDVKAFYSTLEGEASGIPKHYTRKMLDSGGY
uniref:Flavin-containing monooxygenase n=2 Tax=Populus trichocarpa TaxID=3694 RepID=B9GVH6_POPTR